jgi:hypothetical protein
MKRRLLQTLVLASMLWGGSMQMKADGLAFLVIEQQDGEKVSYALNDIRKITFDSDYMYLNLSSGTTEALPFEVLSNLTVDGDDTGFELISKEKTGMELKDGTLSLDMKSDGTVTLYDAAGKTVRTIAVRAGQNSVSLGEMPKGMYIVKVNGSSQKILNK